jgi:hypothetical protein
MHSLGRLAFVATDEPALLASLAPTTAASVARGPREMFRALFAEPFGSRALAQLRAEPVHDAPVYGVTNADVERLQLLLRQVSTGQRSRRYAAAAGLAAGGALGLGTGLAVMAREGVGDLNKTGQVFGVTQSAVGAALLVTSPLLLAIPDRGERLQRDFERDLTAHPDDRAGVLARGEQRLFEAAAGARRERHSTMVLTGAVTALELALFVQNELRDDPNDGIRFGVGGSLLLLGATAFTQLLPTELERLADLWRSDPGRAMRTGALHLPRIGLAPLPGGGFFTLGGQF